MNCVRRNDDNPTTIPLPPKSISVVLVLRAAKRLSAYVFGVSPFLPFLSGYRAMASDY